MLTRTPQSDLRSKVLLPQLQSGFPHESPWVICCSTHSASPLACSPICTYGHTSAAGRFTHLHVRAHFGCWRVHPSARTGTLRLLAGPPRSGEWENIPDNVSNYPFSVYFSFSQFKCCGWNNYTDWSWNQYFNCTQGNPSSERCAVPYSCCTPVPGEVGGGSKHTYSAFRKYSYPFTYSTCCCHSLNSKWI